MHWVKQVFDEAGLCNPGKLLPREQVAPDAGSAPRAPAEPDIGSAIASELGSGCLLDDGGAFVIDGRPAPLVAAPRSLEQLAGLMTLASRARWAVVPAGQGTWLAGGFPLKRVDLVVSTMRLGTGGGGGGGGRGGGGGAIDHAPDDLLATVSAGVTLDELNARLARGGQWWPLDPPGAGTVGATIATGSAGPLAASYGTPRDLVLGLTLVRADGRIVRAGGRVVKNVAGYDMVRLYTGSWGTLGIIAEAHLRLCPLPAADETRVMTAGHPGQLAALAAELSRGARLAPAAAEIVSPAGADALGQRTGHWRMAVRWLGHEAAVADAVAEAKGAAARSGVLFDRREGVWKRASALEERLRPGLSVRVDVPPRAIEEMIPHATLLAGGEHPPLQASPLTGRMWIFVPAPLYEATKSARLWALRLAELRRAAEQCGGGARVELAPASLRGQFDPWGEVGATLSWQAGLKRRFDPDGILKTGFFVGGL
jgi:glycolate oxidase FAD binding subunit